MPLNEHPHVWGRGLDAVFCLFLSNRSRAFSFSPQGKDFFPEREHRRSIRESLRKNVFGL